MFIDKDTQIEIEANLNASVIHGTHRPCDLVPVFLEVIKNTPEYAQLIQALQYPLNVINDPSTDDYDNRWDSEEVFYFLDELFDTLDLYSPDGYYFGSHIGNGSDFGYWMTEEESEKREIAAIKKQILTKLRSKVKYEYFLIKNMKAKITQPKDSIFLSSANDSLYRKIDKSKSLVRIMCKVARQAYKNDIKSKLGITSFHWDTI